MPARWNFPATWLLRLCAIIAIGLHSPALPAQENETPAAAAERPPLIDTATFSKRSPYRRLKLSPDGSQLAISMVSNGNTIFAVMDVEAGTLSASTAMPEDYSLRWFRWAGNKRILISLLGYDERNRLPMSRLIVMDVEHGSYSFIGNKRMGMEGDDVLYVDPDGEWLLLSLQKNVYQEPEVLRFPLDGSEPDEDNLVQKRKRGVWEWIADNTGVVRVGLGTSGTRLRVLYRKEATEKFRVIAKLSKDSDEEELWDVFRIIAGSDEGLMIDEGPGGRLALMHFNYATREKGEVIYENADWDLTGADTDRYGNPVAVYFTDDRDRIVWLDEEMAKTQTALETALGGKEAWISSRAEDDSRMLVWTGAPNDPGAYYLYTPAKKSLSLLATMRPGLDPSWLAPTRPISYTARDGTEIRAYLTLPVGHDPHALPLIIIPHGGPYGVRDKLDYSDEVQLLANRGYAVLQPNFRGSSGYGQAFEELGDGQIGRAMQDDLDDAMDWAVAEGITDPARVCIVGSSYGGYVALWGVIRNPERYRCAASFAGVTDLQEQYEYDRSYFSKKGRKAWRAQLTGEDEQFDLDLVSPARRAMTLSRPVLLIHGKKDGTVPFDQFKRMRSALERRPGDRSAVEYLVLDEAGHGFSRPEDEQAYYDRLLEFLARYNPAD